MEKLLYLILFIIVGLLGTCHKKQTQPEGSNQDLKETITTKR